MRYFTLTNCITALFVYLLLMSECIAQAEFQSEREIQTYLETLTNDEKSTPLEKIKTLEQIIAKSKEQEWANAYLHASVQRLENLVELEEISAAKIGFEDLRPIAAKQNDPSISTRLELIEINIMEGNGYSQALVDKSRAMLLKADKSENLELAGDIYLAIGRIKGRLSDYSSALGSLSKALTLAEEMNDISFLDEVLNEIGTVNVRMHNYSSGIKYYLRSLEISTAQNARFNQSVILYNIAHAYSQNGDFEESKTAFTQSLTLSEELNDQSGVHWVKRGLADLAIKQQNWQEAVSLYTEAEVFFRENDDKFSQFRALNGLAEAHIAMQNAALAEQYLIESVQLLQTFPNMENTFRFQKLKAKLEYLKGDYEQAFYILEDNIEILQQARIDDKKKEVEKQRIRLDSDSRDYENRLLAQKGKLLELKVAQQKSEKILWLSIVILAALSLTIVIFMLFKQIQLRDRFKLLALKDHLTKSPNRRAILEYAETCFKHSVSTSSPLTIGIVDLDNFKLLNDKYGHIVGDNVLIAFSKACKEVMPQPNNYGRYGGEEWLLVLQNSSEETTHSIINRLKKSFYEQPIHGLPKEHKVTFSVGITSYRPEKDKSLAFIISRADNNLYLGKRNGKDQVVF